MLRLIPRPTAGAAGATVLGAAIPFLLGADPASAQAALQAAPEGLPWWALLLISAASPACAWAASVALTTAGSAIAAWLRARGQKKLEDGDPKNDAEGAAEVAAADAIDRKVAALDKRNAP